MNNNLRKSNRPKAKKSRRYKSTSTSEEAIRINAKKRKTGEASIENIRSILGRKTINSEAPSPFTPQQRANNELGNRQ